MKRSQTAVLAGLVALLGLILVVAAKAQAPAAKAPTTLKADVSRGSKQKQDVVEAIFKALGPEVRNHLRAGKKVELPGVGVFQVVRVAQHRDLVGGVPKIVPAYNYIEFVPTGELNAVANAPGAVPARTIEGYEFRSNPNGAPSSRIESQKVPRSRTTQ